MQPAQIDGARRYLALDALRGVAAISILTRHLPDRSFVTWLPGSYLAVDLFFLLSGFVIAHAYGDRIQKDLGFWGFVTRRVIRLWPLYLIGTAIGMVGLILRAWSGEVPVYEAIIHAVFSAFMIPNPPGVMHGPFPLNAPAWSLFFEVFANVLLALLYVRFPRIRIELVTLVGLAMIIVAAVCNGSLEGGWIYHNAYVGLGRVMFSFFAGVLLSKFYSRQIVRWKLPTPVLCAVMIGVFAVPVLGVGRTVFDLAAVCLVFPMIVLMGANSQPEKFTRLYVSLGGMSYALYAFHGPLIVTVGYVLKRFLGYDYALSGMFGSLIIMSTCIVLAVLLNRYFDEPVRKRLTAAFRSAGLKA